ncbi:Uma2 family endonuclease [soil metagenome]
MTVAAPSKMTLEEFLADPNVDRRAEYLFGEVYEPKAESFWHSFQSTFLVEALSRVFGANRAIREFDLPLPRHRPRPDVLVLREPLAAYRSRGGFQASDVLIVIEVCLSTPDRDYQIKDAIYAEASVPEYWIVDLVAKTVERRTEPTPLGYSKREVFFRGAEILGISVNDILGLSHAA